MEDQRIMQRILARLLTFLAGIALIATTLGGTIALAGDGGEEQEGDGAVFTQTNAAAANAVLMFHRMDDGTLTAAGSYPSGGLGSGVGLGSQGAVTLSENGRWLFVGDAGSEQVRAVPGPDPGPPPIGRNRAGGTKPIQHPTS